MGQQFSVDEILGVVDDEEHNGFGNEISTSFGDYFHVRIHQIPDGFHLPLELRVERSGSFGASLETS